ncbi:mechanosensitive ion channel family protein [Acetomicrobium sp. UBA5826]|uniref:mechanosensitive ion channel family protein n=1 Tax=Acetomicrobium sp. UBA5826 TaxID=1946039 RepID=UPI002579B6A1|nr:mechanosensitive ion channel family protein [Acetomicrobium sp. UBA5826]
MDTMIWGNSVGAWIVALVAGVVSFFTFYYLKKIADKYISFLFSRRPSTAISLVLDLVRQINVYFLVLLAILAGSSFLSLPLRLSRAISMLVVLFLLLQVGLWGNKAINFWLTSNIKRKVEKDPSGATMLSALGFMGRLLFWGIIILIALQNMGIEVSALVAGLGIGGIAVALAAQNILGDLFASWSIVLDKPFLVGDFIVIDGYSGTVEHIGLKTTRLRSLTGEQLIFSNSDLLKCRIRNYKRMQERRVVFSFGVLYETPLEKLKEIPDIVKNIITSIENARFDRAHFASYGNFSLNFEVVYYVLSSDYTVYMDIQQRINLALFEEFKKRDIVFAYPTQTIYVSGAEPISVSLKGQPASKGSE